MPVLVLGLFQGASWTRYVRSAMLDVIRLDYVTTARSKGLRERAVIMKHVVRNALIPVVTLVALTMPQVFGGAIVTEQIFRVPGIGSLLIDAILRNDTPVIMARDLRLLVPRHPLQPDRRPALWLARPPHQLSLAPAVAVAAPRRACATSRRAAEAWRRFRRHKLAVAGLVVLVVMVLMVAFGPLVWKLAINDIDFTARLQTPTAAHPFGTDDLGQDIFARMLYGGRISLAVGLAAMLMAMLVGVTIGAIAGISRGAVDAALMWLTDLFLSLPQLPLLLILIYLFRDALKAAFGPEVGVFILIVLVIGGFRWMPVARLVRAQFFSLREKEFVEAARALGASVPRQVVRHILPNSLGPVIVAGTIDVAAAIIAESTLSFLGLGFPPDIPTWGRILFDSKEYLDIAPHWALFPGTRDLPRGAVHQLRRRRPARRARSAPGALMSAPIAADAVKSPSRSGCRRRPTGPLLQIKGLKTHFKTDDGWLHAVDGVDIVDRSRRDGVRRRRVGLRQDRDGDDGAEAAADAARQDRRRPGAVAGPRPRDARAARRCAASAPRRSRSSSRSR